MRRLALFCYERAGWVIAAWLIILVALTGAARVAGTDFRDTINLPASDSQRAQDLLKQVTGGQATGDTEHIVFATATGTIADPDTRDRIEPMLAQVAAMPHVARVVSPYTTQGAAQVAAGGRVAFATVTYDTSANNLSQIQANQLIDTARAACGPGLRVGVSGLIAERSLPRNLGGAYIGLAAAAVVLLLTFGSLFSMLLPILTAAMSVGTAVAIIGMVTHTMDVARVSPEIAALMGLGVGVDYALFIVSRYRQGLMAGRTPREALGAAAVTSGRSVLFAGLTVCVAVLGMFAVRLDILYGIAIASSIAVLLTMIAALTLLPALLRLFGVRVLSRRERRRLACGEQRRAGEGRAWGRWAAGITRRPVLAALASLVVILVLALPIISMRLGIAGPALDPPGSTTRLAYDLVAEGFGPGYTTPLTVVGRVDTPAQRQAVARVARALAAQPDVARVLPPVFVPSAVPSPVPSAVPSPVPSAVPSPVPSAAPGGSGAGAIAVVTAYPASAAQDKATTDLVHAVRDTVIPAATAGSGATLYVGGSAAINVDFSQAITDRLPLFIAVVVAISFVLLLIVFRSLVVPLTAAAMNLLAAGVAFGVVTAVFQWGWAGPALGMNRTGPIEAYVPVLLFAGLFGLSMDYEVFLVGRIQEEWYRTGDNRQAVVRGLAATGRTITAAAIIMVLVFGSFILTGDRVVRMAGLGLAVAVLLDAVVIRSLLVPAVMALIGAPNWWLPRWLGRVLPRIKLDEDATGPAPDAAGGPEPEFVASATPGPDRT